MVMRPFIAVFCVFCAFLACIIDNQITISGISADGSGFHIVLDAGHGGNDMGAVVAGVREAEINLAVVKKIQAELTARGFAVTLTRTNGDSLNSPYALNKKKDDMAKRRELITKLSPDLVISVHHNTYPNPNVYGLQCFYATENAGGKEYAEAIQKQFNDSGLITYKTVKRTDFNLCEHSTAPAVLVECGFLSNPTERALLVTGEYQQILAWNIAEAVDKATAGNKVIQ